VFVKINGKQHYLWRAVGQGGEVVDVYLQAKRDGAAAKRFLGRNDSRVPMLLYPICSTWAVTWSGQNTIGISGQTGTVLTS